MAIQDIAKQLKKLNIPSIESTAEQGEEKHTVYAKLFCLGSAATWLVIGYDPEDEIIFCYADLYGKGRDGGAEWGYTSVEELKSLRWGSVPRVELDAHFDPTLFPKCVNEEGRITV